MKSLEKHKFVIRRIVSVVLLSGILWSGNAAIAAANTAPKNLPEQKCKPTQQQGDSTTQLPPQVADAVRQDVSQRENIPVNRLRVTTSSRETWSDGCLGLAQADEFCTQALVEGWRVSVSDGRSTWVYRTDSLGRVVRREEPQTTSSLPATVSHAVLQQAAQHSGLPVSALRIVQAQRRQWSDSCLGLGSPEVLCATVVVPGWLVRVRAGEQQLVYRTGDFGSQPVLDKTASLID